MKIRTILAAVLLAISFSANADFTTVAEAYEIDLNNFRVPVTAGGTLAYRRCADCEYETRRMGSNLTFRVNGNIVDLTEFRKSVLTVRERDGKVVIVKHDFASDTIVSLSISL